ncbi:hypothetical protein [Streptomyces sp. YIM B13508]|uniref:hypothetical protein n=1 Tax=Streptomyces sp. YIM B13508 TaxID=3366315 RepID=UPI00367B5F98
MNNVVSELYAVLTNSNLTDMPDKPVDIERDAALSMTLGKQAIHRRGPGRRGRPLPGRYARSRSC